MEKVYLLIRELLLSGYISQGKVMSFQGLQNKLAHLGFRYYLDGKGKVKLYIKKKIYPKYKYLKKVLPVLKNERDVSYNHLKFLIDEYVKGNVSHTYVDNTIKFLSDSLTKKDKDEIRKLFLTAQKSKKEKSKNEEEISITL